jgi:CubicO group peptidase (beta-lactamase class C family)
MAARHRNRQAQSLLTAGDRDQTALVMRRARLYCAVFALALAAVSRAQSSSGSREIAAELASPLAADREQALDELIRTHDLQAERLPRLVRLLDDPDFAVAGKAATALALRGEQAWPTLTQVLADGSPQQRWGATVALYQAHADIRPFLPVLTQQLAQPDARLVRATLGALARMRGDAAGALPALRPLLSHEDLEIRWATLGTLAAIGPAAGDYARYISPILQDASAELRLIAAEAMRSIQPPAPIPAAQLATYLDWMRGHVPRLMEELDVPGVSIAVVQQGAVRWTQGFGVRDVRDRSPVTVDTVFEACSMSKPILALVAMQLVQEGRLDLDRPLIEYLGHDYLPDQPEHRRITARMALTHRTGLANWRLGYDEMGGPLSLHEPPGAAYTYSGEGILFLQRALEAVAGQPLERLAMERLFAPLGLARTSFVWTKQVEADLASGHRADGGFKERTRYRKANGAYSLYTTPAEYARLMLTVLHPERLGERSFSPASIALLRGRQLRIDDDDALDRPGRARAVATYRGLVFKLDVTAEGDIAWHSGSNSSGFKSYGQLNPDKGSGLVIFTNGDNGTRLRAAVLEHVGDL